MAGAPKARSWIRFLPALLLVGLFVFGLASGAARHFSLAELKAHHHELHLYAIVHPMAAAGLFLAVFVVAVASGLPVALVLTIAGGAIFGPVFGAGLVMFGATLGATITYGAARMAVGSALQPRAEQSSGTVRRIIDSFGRNTFAHILTMRLIPLFPFSPVNIAAGLARVPLRPFVLATLVGEVPTAGIYASLGSGLGRALSAGAKPPLDHLRDPWLILPLVGLALLSLAPNLIRRWNARRGQA
jgi:uncharacterized membrane protein YdjX (TVP38/TMEM64 family)